MKELRHSGFLVLTNLAIACNSQPDPKPQAEPGFVKEARKVAVTPHVTEPARGNANAATTGNAATANSAAQASQLRAIAEIAKGLDAPKMAQSGVASSSTNQPPPANSVSPDKANGGAKASTTKIIQGPVISGEGFRAWLQTSDNLQAGEPGNVRVVLEALAPYKCNEEYPYKFKASSGQEMGISETIRGMNVGKKTSTMNIPVSPANSGTKQLSGDFSFSVCTEDKCLVEKQKLSVALTVAGAS